MTGFLNIFQNGTSVYRVIAYTLRKDFEKTDICFWMVIPLNDPDLQWYCTPFLLSFFPYLCVLCILFIAFSLLFNYNEFDVICLSCYHFLHLKINKQIG